jgi:toxin ParE1/3/4
LPKATKKPSPCELPERVARAIYDEVQSLQTMPYRGRYGRLENTRELMVPRLSYILVYEVSAVRVVILNILPGAQRWP